MERYFFMINPEQKGVSRWNGHYFELEFQQRWSYDMNQQWGRGEHTMIGLIGRAGLVIWVLGFIAGMRLLLQFKRDELQDEACVRKYGFMYLGYDVYYWECTKRFQAFMYAGIANYAFGDQRARLTLYALVAGMNAILHIIVSPYDDRKNGLLDSLERDALISIFVTMVLLQLVVTFLDMFTLQQQMIILGMIAAVNFLFLGRAVYYGLRELLFHSGLMRLQEERAQRDEERKAQRDERNLANERADQREAQRRLNEQRLARVKAQGGGGEAVERELEEEAEEEEEFMSEEEEEEEQKDEIPSLVKRLVIFVKSLHPYAYMARVVERKAAMETRLVLVETGPRSIKSMFVGRTPRGKGADWRYIVWNGKPKIGTELQIVRRQQQFIVRSTVLSYFRFLVLEQKWEELHGDLYHFVLRVLIAFVQRERFGQDYEKFPREVYDFFYQQSEENQTGEPEPRQFDEDGDENVSLVEIMSIPLYKLDFLKAQKAHFSVDKLEKAAWGYKDVSDDISYTGDELFRAYQKSKAMDEENTKALFAAFQRRVEELVEEEALQMGHVVADGDDADETFANPLWDAWDKKRKMNDLSTPHGFLPGEFERPSAAEPTSPKGQMPNAFLQVARTHHATHAATPQLEDEQQEAPMNPIDITVQDLQKWRDNHEKKVADMRIQAAIDAEEAQQASAVAVPGFEWTGLTGLGEAPAPDGLITVTIRERGPLGVEVEWSIPPRFVAVVPGSLAFLAGLRTGDELAEIDRADVRDWGGERIAPLLAMRPLSLRVLRPGQLTDGAGVGVASLDDVQLELSNSPPRANGGSQLPV
jgi:hypothetical protein